MLCLKSLNGNLFSSCKVYIFYILIFLLFPENGLSHWVNLHIYDGKLERPRTRALRYIGIGNNSIDEIEPSIETNQVEVPNIILNDCQYFNSELSHTQRKLCLLFQDHLPNVIRGVKIAIDECRNQFKHHKWNCTQINNDFGILLDRKPGSRESSFLLAISSAGVSYFISKSCRAGSLTSCGCGSTQRPSDLNYEFKWTGCSDDLVYGYKFTKDFIDLREYDKEKESLKSIKKKSKKKYHRRAIILRKLANIHNLEVGRRIILSKTKINCKCHGVSGSCTIITCWHSIPPFKEIGEELKQQYEKATLVKLSPKKSKLQIKRKNDKIPTAIDFVYYQRSPDYCSQREELGVLGVSGRECNSKTDCKKLCCKLGWNSTEVEINERCNCSFKWCCKINCEICHQRKVLNYCN